MKILIVVAPIVGLFLSHSASAESIYSVKSLRTLCTTDEQYADLACKTFIHGVVETWSQRDIISVSPDRYRTDRRPVFCETINKVSDTEWKKIVVEELQSATEPGFAAEFVAEALHRRLCE